MTAKQALIFVFSIGAICIISTWYFGHIWVFIGIILAALLSIALYSFRHSKKPDTNQTQCKDESEPN